MKQKNIRSQASVMTAIQAVAIFVAIMTGPATGQGTVVESFYAVSDGIRQAEVIWGYEVSIVDDDDEGYVFIQVIGAPDRASTIELTGISDNTGIAEARIRKARSNETLRLRFNHGGGGSISAGDHIVASWEVNDGEFVLNGFEFLENNIAWSTLRNVLRDEHLNEAIVSFVNSEMSQASGDDVHSGCAELCGMDYPTPDDCNGAIDSYLCCINEAQKDYCRRNCVCAAKYSEWWQAVQGGVCRKAANSAVMIDLIACTPSFIL